jgi:archaemetzincin
LGDPGEVEKDVIRVVADGLQGLLRLSVDVLELAPIPADAFIASRGQYNAMILLKHLVERHLNGYTKILGLTCRDITNPILTYVFGEGYMGGSAAVMSCLRLRTDPNGRPASREAFLERVVKVAVHEIGHTFSIPHCQEGRCVMRASNGLLELDEKLNYLCGYCELFLSEEVAKILAEQPEEPVCREMGRH